MAGLNGMELSGPGAASPCRAEAGLVGKQSGGCGVSVGSPDSSCGKSPGCRLWHLCVHVAFRERFGKAYVGSCPALGPFGILFVLSVPAMVQPGCDPFRQQKS